MRKKRYAEALNAYDTAITFDPANVGIFQVEHVNHSNVRCDDCHKPVFGRRYRCTVCDDFDLCTQCFQKSMVFRHASREGHEFLKIPSSGWESKSNEDSGGRADNNSENELPMASEPSSNAGENILTET